MIYALPDAARRERLLPAVIGWNVRYAWRYGEVYATPDFAGAAVWLTPGNTTMTLGRMLRAGLWQAPLTVEWSLLRRLAGVWDSAAELQRRHAPMAHWYLSQIGVEPLSQGHGLGSALLRPMLAHLDANQEWCYLETAEASNLPFYRHLGFAVVDESSVGHGRVPVWALLRQPGPA
ncbi:MAG TPA: GNAT family N-acetyltransferase [Ktedonobacterales bacterium]